MSPSSLTAPSSLCASLLPPSSSYLMNFARLISSLDNVPPSVPLALAFGAFADPVGFAGAAVVAAGFVIYAPVWEPRSGGSIDERTRGRVSRRRWGEPGKFLFSRNVLLPKKGKPTPGARVPGSAPRRCGRPSRGWFEARSKVGASRWMRRGDFRTIHSRERTCVHGGAVGSDSARPPRARRFRVTKVRG